MPEPVLPPHTSGDNCPVLAVAAGTLHPGDVQMAPPASIDDQIAGAFGALRGALSA